MHLNWEISLPGLLYGCAFTHVYTRYEYVSIYIHNMCVVTRKCRKVCFMVFASILVIPEVCWLAGDRLQADELPTLPPHSLT